MTQTSQAHPFGAPMQQLWSDTLSMTLEGMQATQAQGTKLVRTALEMATVSAKDNVKYAQDMYGRITDAANQVNGLLREQTSLLSDLPKDPVGATQRAIAGYFEGSRRFLEFGAAILKGHVGLVRDALGSVEKSSEEMRETYVEYFGTLQKIVEAKTKKA
jgi:hypothetical protein